MARKKDTEPALWLTKAEEQVMQALWKAGRGFANEIVAAYPDPKPAYNTVLTVIRVLERKGFVTHETFNRANRYKAVVGREEYALRMARHIADDYFGGSYERLIEAISGKIKADNKQTTNVSKVSKL